MKAPIVVFADERAVVGDLRGYFGTVISYALKCNRESPNSPKFQSDPIAAVERAISRGEKLQWFNRSSSVMTSDREANLTREQVWQAAKVFAFGDVVMLEGRCFELAPDFNRNVKLVPVALEEVAS